jgi:hypothetical protein
MSETYCGKCRKEARCKLCQLEARVAKLEGKAGKATKE